VQGPQGLQGDTGTQGAQGDVGAQGTQGAQGINTPVAGGYFYTTAHTPTPNSGTIAPNAEIPMTTTGATYGTTTNPAPALAADGGLQLAAGTYVISYSMTSDADAGNEEVQDYLTLNGTEIPGSRTTTTQPGGSAGFFNTSSNTMTITVPTGGAELQLHNGVDEQDFNVNTDGTIFQTGALNIEQVQ